MSATSEDRLRHNCTIYLEVWDVPALYLAAVTYEVTLSSAQLSVSAARTAIAAGASIAALLTVSCEDFWALLLVWWIEPRHYF